MKDEELDEYTKDAIAELEAGSVYVGEFGREIISRAVRKACAEAFDVALVELGRLEKRVDEIDANSPMNEGVDYNIITAIEEAKKRIQAHRDWPSEGEK
jgi:hypothetical protein